MKKTNYEQPNINIIKFNVADVIQVSGDTAALSGNISFGNPYLEKGENGVNVGSTDSLFS